MEAYEITETTEDGIEILGGNCKVGDIVQSYKDNTNTKRVEEVIGWVCGIIYHDGNEWLYAEKDLNSSYPDCRKEEKTKMLGSKEKALEHLRKFNKWERCPRRFIRPYIYDHPKKA